MLILTTSHSSTIIMGSVGEWSILSAKQVHMAMVSPTRAGQRINTTRNFSFSMSIPPLDDGDPPDMDTLGGRRDDVCALGARPPVGAAGGRGEDGELVGGIAGVGADADAAGNAVSGRTVVSWRPRAWKRECTVPRKVATIAST